jgi:EAL domain-containing protein (putative c-di-GMP-specific phosphodiesterase class I)/ActR/RegA family two-component response regulator
MTNPTPKTVLVVDDDDETLRAHERLLTRAGFTVETAFNGKEALDRIGKSDFQAVVSDISMPELDGISFLRGVRELDLDLPVILVTGSPDVATAAAAVQYGALRYLVKPVAADVLTGSVDRAVRLYEYARARRAEALGGAGSDIGDYAAIDARLTRALAGLWMAFQPIVRYRSKEIHAYEALMRTTDRALPSPPAILEAAERLSRHHDVGRAVRKLVAAAIANVPEVRCFVNLHVRDLLDESLFEPDAALHLQAKRVVLELTERAALEVVKDLPARVARLRQLGYRIAVDDLGAGYSGLTSLAQLEPDIVKVDMSLVRDVHREPKKQKLVSAIASLCRDLGTELVVEGVETVEERDQLLELGCELFQGYLFAKPSKPFVDVVW